MEWNIEMHIHNDSKKEIKDIEIPKQEETQDPSLLSSLLFTLLSGFTTGKWQFKFTWKF